MLPFTSDTSLASHLFISRIPTDCKHTLQTPRTEPEMKSLKIISHGYFSIRITSWKKAKYIKMIDLYILFLYTLAIRSAGTFSSLHWQLNHFRQDTAHIQSLKRNVSTFHEINLCRSPLYDLPGYSHISLLNANVPRCALACCENDTLIHKFNVMRYKKRTHTSFSRA